MTQQNTSPIQFNITKIPKNPITQKTAKLNDPIDLLRNDRKIIENHKIQEQNLINQGQKFIAKKLENHGQDWQLELKNEKVELKSKIDNLESTISNLYQKLDFLQIEATDLTEAYEKHSQSIESDLDVKTVFQSILDQRLSDEDLITAMAFARKYFEIICRKVEDKYESDEFENFDFAGENSDAVTASTKTPLNQLITLVTKNNFKNWSKNLNLITIHQLRKKSLTLSYAYDSVAEELNFDNSGDKNSDLLTLLQFYHHFAGDKLTESNQLKETIKAEEVNRFISHLQTSVQDTKLLKALTDAIKTVKKHFMK